MHRRAQRVDARYRQSASVGRLRLLHSLGALAVGAALGSCGGGQSGGELNSERPQDDGCACPSNRAPSLVARVLHLDPECSELEVLDVSGVINPGDFSALQPGDVFGGRLVPWCSAAGPSAGDEILVYAEPPGAACSQSTQCATGCVTTLATDSAATRSGAIVRSCPLPESDSSAP